MTNHGRRAAGKPKQSDGNADVEQTFALNTQNGSATSAVDSDVADPRTENGDASGVKSNAALTTTTTTTLTVEDILPAAVLSNFAFIKARGLYGRARGVGGSWTDPLWSRVEWAAGESARRAGIPLANRLVVPSWNYVQGAASRCANSTRVALAHFVAMLVGFGVLVMQIGTWVAVVYATFLLNLLIATRDAPTRVIQQGQAVRKRAVDGIGHVKKSVEKNVADPLTRRISDVSNSALDVVEGVVDKIIGPDNTPQPVDLTIFGRTQLVVKRTGNAFYGKVAQNTEPLRETASATVERLGKYVELARHWGSAQLPKGSLTDVMHRIEQEAGRLKQQPSVILLQCIRSSAGDIRRRLEKLRPGCAELVGISSRVEKLLDFVVQFENHLEKAKDLQGIQNEVFNEASAQLEEARSWLDQILPHHHKSPSPVADGSSASARTAVVPPGF